VSINDVGDNLILTYTASLTLYGVMNVTIHNQYPDIELISPVYFCNRGAYNEYPIERTDDSATMKIEFRFGLDKLPGGILMYEVQRKEKAKSDHRSNTDTTSTEAIEYTSKMIRLLVVWKFESFRKPRVYIVLAEHDNALVLNEDKLAQLYDKINDVPSSHNLSGWLMCDNTALTVTYKTVMKKGHELEITISGGVKNEYTRQALWIDPERQVSYLIVMYFY
jgi:hypothetical protein